MGRDGGEIGLRKVAVRRKEGNSVWERARKQGTGLCLQGCLGGKEMQLTEAEARASLTCRSHPQVWLDPDHQDSSAFSDFSTRDIIEKEEKSG